MPRSLALEPCGVACFRGLRLRIAKAMRGRAARLSARSHATSSPKPRRRHPRARPQVLVILRGNRRLTFRPGKGENGRGLALGWRFDALRPHNSDCLTRHRSDSGILEPRKVGRHGGFIACVLPGSLARDEEGFLALEG